METGPRVLEYTEEKAETLYDLEAHAIRILQSLQGHHKDLKKGDEWAMSHASVFASITHYARAIERIIAEDVDVFDTTMKEVNEEIDYNKRRNLLAAEA